MARDYSARRNGEQNASGKPKRKPRANTARPNKPARKPAANAKPGSKPKTGTTTPGWVWFISGLCLAAAVAAGVYIFARPAGEDPDSRQISIDTPNGGPPTADPSAAAGGGDSAAQPTQAPAKKTDEPRFSFYKMLPNYKVSVPEDDTNSQASRGDDGRVGAHEKQPAARPEPTPSTVSAPEPTSRASEADTPRSDSGPGYVIQAGSFSTPVDADRRKAQLALLGVSATIVDIDLASGKTVYRVQSEPMVSNSEVEQLVQRLRDNSIDTMVRRAD